MTSGYAGEVLWEGGTVFAVDPGLGGATAWVRGSEAGALPTALRDGVREVDAAALAAAIRDSGAVVVVVERVWRPNKLVRAAAKAVAAAEFCGVEVVEPTPAQWRRAVLGDAKADKAAAVAWARRAFPATSLRRTKRARTDDHNLAEALCLGRYGQLYLQGAVR